MESRLRSLLSIGVILLLIGLYPAAFPRHLNLGISIVLFGALLLKEPITLRQALAILLATAGVAAVIGPE
nr:hypothetical protein [Bacillota bacterium]